jgi:hypothetical protein
MYQSHGLPEVYAKPRSLFPEEFNDMHRKLLRLSAFLVIALVAAQAQQSPPPKTHLKVGQPAPDFTMRGTDGKTYKLSEFKGKKNVVLAFYVLAFTGG